MGLQFGEITHKRVHCYYCPFLSKRHSCSVTCCILLTSHLQNFSMQNSPIYKTIITFFSNLKKAKFDGGHHPLTCNSPHAKQVTITWHSQFGCQSTATSRLQFTGTTINSQSTKLDSQPTFSQSVRDSLAWQSAKTENGAGEWWGQVHGCIFLIMLLGSCQCCPLVMFVCLPHFPCWKKLENKEFESE